jgi:hypothetical protein
MNIEKGTPSSTRSGKILVLDGARFSVNVKIDIEKQITTYSASVWSIFTTKLEKLPIKKTKRYAVPGNRPLNSGTRPE